MRIRVSQVVQAAALLATVLLAGCSATSGRQAPASLAPASLHIAHGRRTLLPLSFSQIAMGSTQSGWALPAATLQSRDAGQTWTGPGPRGVSLGSPLGAQGQVAGASGLVVAESFPAPRVAVVATKQPNGVTVNVYETTDGGRHWNHSSIPLPASQAANLQGGAVHLQFVSASEGWVFLSSQGMAGTTLNALFRTTDGGRQWQLLQRAQAPSGQAPVFEDVQAVAFQRTGWGVATVNSPALDSARVLITTNGGATWAVTQLPLPPTAAQTQAVEGAPSLSARDEAWIPLTMMQASGRTEQLVLNATTDGGRHWTARTWPTLLPLSTTFVLAGSRIFIADGQRTAKYQLSLSPVGSPTWSQMGTLSTLSPTASAFSEMLGGG